MFDNDCTQWMSRSNLDGPEEDERQERAVFFGWKQGNPPLDSGFRAMMEQKSLSWFEPLERKLGLIVLTPKSG